MVEAVDVHKGESGVEGWEECALRVVGRSRAAVAWLVGRGRSTSRCGCLCERESLWRGLNVS